MAGRAILRRSFLAGVLLTVAASGLRASQTAGAAERALRGTRQWPTRAEWRALDRTVGGRLIRPVAPWARLSPGAPVPKRLRNPFYLEEHANRTSRRLHFIGTSIALALLIAALVLQIGWLVALAIVQGYAFAWVGHFFFEHNKPATFTHPLYSLMGDWVMFKDILIGRIPF